MILNGDIRAWLNIRLRILRCATLELVFVFRSSIRLVFRLGIFAVERSSAAVLAEELGSALIATNLHNTKLVPLPLC